MKTEYAKMSEAIDLLTLGWEIYTHRGSAPYKPLYFRIYMEGEDSKRIHPKTIEALIRMNIINGIDAKYEKYKLKLNH